jgi:NAD(P)-dependent dehydrogenase (short-subunit alcohol dehydrogenase family)
MASNRIHIAAAPEDVFAVLADPYRYPEWVVGAARVNESEGDFPQPGSRFHHEVGAMAMTLSDVTEAIEAEPPHRLLLKAKARPLGTARIEISLRAAAAGTEVILDERPDDRLTAFVAGNPAADAVLRIRNAVALSRLKRLVEGKPALEPTRHRELAGQRVLVTGGSSGIGLATARVLVEEEARVTLLARNEEGLARARRKLEAGGGDVATVVADVTDEAALENAVADAAAGMGGIDVVVAAAAGAAFGPFAETSAADFDATIETILCGTANTIRATLPRLERGAGSLVVVGSIASRMPLPGLSAYTAAKHGLAGLLWTLRVELAEAGVPVTVSLVNPGAVDTPFWDHLESATGLLPPVPPGIYSPEEVAEAVVATICEPREELTVGSSAKLQAMLSRHLGGLANKALTGMARLAFAAGDRRAQAGALRRGRGSGETGHG